MTSGTKPDRAARAIETAGKVLRDYGVNPELHPNGAVTGIDTTRRMDKIFHFELLGTDEGGVIGQLDDMAGYIPEAELEAAKERAARVSEDPKCLENGERVMRIATTQLRLGNFKLAVIVKIQPEAGQEVVSEERFRNRFLLDAYSLFTKFELLKALEE